jgi:hypothetical protein
MCLLYSDEAERRDLLARFLLAGVVDKDRLGYFSDSWALEDLHRYLCDAGLPVDELARAGQCTLYETQDVYCPNGRFSPEDMWKKLGLAYRDAIRDGFAGARLTGEMTWALKGIPGSERLVEYERGVNEVIAAHPLTGICQYDTRLFKGDLLQSVMKVHPYLVAGGRIIQNPQFERLSS